MKCPGGEFCRISGNCRKTKIKLNVGHSQLIEIRKLGSCSAHSFAWSYGDFFTPFSANVSLILPIYGSFLSENVNAEQI